MGHNRHDQRCCIWVKEFIAWWFNSSMVLVIVVLILLHVSLVNVPFKALSISSLANGSIISVSDDGECAAANDKCVNDVVFVSDGVVGSGM